MIWGTFLTASTAMVAILSPDLRQEPHSTPQFTREARDPVTLSLPILYRRAVLGDVLARLDPVDPENVTLDARSFQQAMNNVLNEQGRDNLATMLSERDFVEIGDLADLGIVILYDRERLELVIDRIDPSFSNVSSFGATPYRETPVTISPERTSAYLNILPEIRFDDFRDVEVTTNLFFAARHEGFVIEADGGYDSTTFGPGLYRRQARALYDVPDKYLRFSAGDLRLQNQSLLGTAFLAGAAIEKGRRIFNPFLPFQSLGPQQVLIDQRSTLEIYSGDTLVDTVVLDTGAYDIATLPARYGLTDARLVVVEPSGDRQALDFDFFFDPADLQKGETEYSIAVGLPATNLNFNPRYDEEPAFSGFYRRGVSNRLILGGGIQTTQNFIAGSAEAILSPQVLPGRISMSAGFSYRESRTGYSGELRYILLDSYNSGIGDLSLAASFQSKEFVNLSQRLSGLASEFTSVSINYSKPIDERTSVLAAGSYNSRATGNDFYLTSIEGLHRLDDRIFIRGGFEYGTYAGEGASFGVRISMTARLGGRKRASVRYSSVRESYSASFSRSAEDRVGGYGYDLTVGGNSGRQELDASGTYVGNRFEARGLVVTGGDGFGNFGQDNSVRLNLGTSIAMAGGDVAIGRPIFDSFLIAKPSSDLTDAEVIVGRNIRENEYDAKSGPLGPGLQSRLTSFSKQTISYDMEGEGRFADIGTGIETLEPMYRSGYRLTVGSGGSASATGTAYIDGRPASLASGSVVSVDDAEFEPTQFFTNSAGRFAIVGLRPGRTYRIVSDDGSEYQFTVPNEGSNLLRIERADLTASSD